MHRVFTYKIVDFLSVDFMSSNGLSIMNKIIKINLCNKEIMRNRIICKECRQELETRSERSMKKCEDCQLQ